MFVEPKVLNDLLISCNVYLMRFSEYLVTQVLNYISKYLRLEHISKMSLVVKFIFDKYLVHMT